MALLSSEPTQPSIKSKNPHLITNTQYNQLSQRFEKLLLPYESLSETSAQLLSSTISQLEALQFEVQLALQGGTLLEDVQQGFESTQVELNLNNLLDRVVQEIGLYKEFIDNKEDLNLDFILNEDLEVNENESFEINRNGAGLLNDQDDLDFASESGGILSPQFSQSVYSEATTQILRRPNTIPLPSMIDDIDFEELRDSAINFKGELIRWVPLLKISDQLFSQKSRETIGYPTLISINTVIAIGTTRGLALIFDFQQKLVSILGSPALALEHGEVTALTISSDGYYLSVGYAKGLILIYSLKTFQRLHNIFPLTPQNKRPSHTIGSTITHLSFLPSNKPRLISADELGAVYLHKFTNRMVMNSKETYKIFDSKDLSNFLSPQENQYPPILLSVKALPLGPRKHSTDTKSLVAILTPQLLTIICIKPKPTVLVKLFRKHLESGVQAQRGKQYSQFLDAGLSGTLAWYPATVDSTDNQDCHPALAFSFGRYVCVLQITPIGNSGSGKSKIKFKTSLEVVKVGDLCTQNPVVSLKWINRKNLIIVDSLERCSVIDLDDVDRTFYLGNLSGFSPLGRDPYTLYHLPMSSDAKQDNIKHHLVYSQSISSYKSKLFILGQTQLYLGLPLTWSEHLFSLVSSGRTVDSILLGLEYLRNGSPYYFSHLENSLAERKERIRPVMIELMVALLNHLFQRCLSLVEDPNHINDPLVIHPLVIEAKEIVNSIIEASIEVEAFDWLLNDVYQMFLDNNYSLVFYEALEPYLLNDVNSNLSENLSPALVQDLFRTYSESPHLLMRLDTLLLKINPILLDLDYTISLCRNHNMTRCLMYIWSCALNDFISPIGELFQNWDIYEEPNWSGELTPVFLGHPTPKSPSPQIDSSASSKNRLFQYLTESLSGWQYPTKTPLSKESSILAWNQLVELTISKKLSNWPSSHQQKLITVPQLIIGGNMVEFSDLIYPYLTFLIKLDISKTIRYLELLDSRGLLVHSQIENTDLAKETSQLSLQLISQSIFELLDSEFEFTLEEVCQLKCFLVRLWALERITLTEELIKNTFDTLANPELSTDFLLTERQDACRNLIKEEIILQIPDLNTILDQCHFLSILKQRLLAKEDYPGVVNCYLKDTNMFNDLVNLTDEIFKHKSINLTKNQKLEIQSLILQKELNLIDWNVRKTVELIELWFDKDHHQIINNLETEESYKYYYLQEYFETKFTNNSQDLLDQLILLKAQKDPQTLLTLLQKLSDEDVHFNMEYCLQLSRQHHITDVTVWILERGGNPNGAMEEILDVLQTRSKKLLEYINSLNSKTVENGSIYDISQQINYQLIRVQSGIKIAIQLCDRVHLKQKQHTLTSVKSRRNSAIGKLEFGNDAEELYFKTLNFIVEIFKQVLSTFGSTPTNEESGDSSAHLATDRQNPTQNVRQIIVDAFKNLVQDLFNSILHPTTSPTAVTPGRSIISLPRILVHIMSSLNSTSSSTPVLGELRDVIYGVLEACRSELRWLTVTLQLLNRDMFSLVHEDYTLRTKGLRGYGIRCTICKDRLINITSGNVIMFRCGHLVHSECLIEKLDSDQETWVCTKCNLAE